MAEFRGLIEVSGRACNLTFLRDSTAELEDDVDALEDTELFDLDLESIILLATEEALFKLLLALRNVVSLS